MHRIDETDATILELLQTTARMKRNAIVEVVGFSGPSVSERKRELEERGVVTGYHAIDDAKRHHFDITAIIFVRVSRLHALPAVTGRRRALF